MKKIYLTIVLVKNNTCILFLKIITPCYDDGNYQIKIPCGVFVGFEKVKKP